MLKLKHKGKEGFFLLKRIDKGMKIVSNAQEDRYREEKL